VRDLSIARAPGAHTTPLLTPVALFALVTATPAAIQRATATDRATPCSDERSPETDELPALCLAGADSR
jgi:hypothetical protein